MANPNNALKNLPKNPWVFVDSFTNEFGADEAKEQLKKTVVEVKLTRKVVVNRRTKKRYTQYTLWTR